MIVISCLAYVASVAAVLLSRFVLGWANEGQSIAGLIAFLAVLTGAVLIDRKWAGPKRTGRQVVANAVVLGSAFILAETLRQRMPVEYPLAVVGLVLPAFLAAEAAVDWRSLARAEPSLE